MKGALHTTKLHDGTVVTYEIYSPDENSLLSVEQVYNHELIIIEFISYGITLKKGIDSLNFFKGVLVAYIWETKGKGFIYLKS